MSLLLLLPIQSALAGSVLVPDYTPRTTSDFALADDLTLATRRALESNGMSVIGPDDIRAQAQGAADGCAEEAACPGNLWPWFTAGLATVGSATYNGGKVDVAVHIYQRDTDAPVLTLRETIGAGDIGAFAVRVAKAAAKLEPAPVELVVPTRPSYESTFDPDSVSRSTPVDEVEELEPDPAPPKTTRSAEGRAAADAERVAMGNIPWSAYDKYRRSGKSQQEWLTRARIRTGAGIVELHLGAVLGDVDRRYDARVAVERNNQGTLDVLDIYQRDGFVNGIGYTIGAAVGYVPLYWLEVGLLGGIQLGDKQLSTGWEQQIAGELIDSDVEVFDPAAATMALIEPRARIYLSAAGVVKPYLLAAVDLRVYDGYQAPDLTEIDYPDRSGGYSLGPTLGLGLAFDPTERGTAFIEVPWTYTVQPTTAFESGGTAFIQLPDKYSGLSQYLAVKVGVGTRF
jgi:hypothetical protein